MTRVARWSACVAAVLLSGSVASAQELRIGVFLPQASFATNAERSAWGERIAAELTAKAAGAFTARAQVFARREDAVAFTGRVDILIADGLFALERGGEVIAHATIAPPVGLYVAGGANVGELRQEAVACAEAGPAEIRFYSNTALGGELAASSFFSEVRSLKDASATLAAVKSRAVAGGFAPVGHPAAAGLKLVAQGGSYPVGVVMVTNKARVDPLREALLGALVQTSGGALGSFARGGSAAYQRARGARGEPRVLSAPPLLTGGSDARPAAPPIRLRTRGQVPPVDLGGALLAKPELREPDRP